MSLQTRLASLITAIGADIKSLNTITTATSGAPSYAAPRTRFFDSSRSVYNLKASNTRRWQYGLSQARNAIDACELWIGDSIVSGGTNIDLTTFDRLNAIPRQYERAINSILGAPIAGTGYVPTQDGTVRDSRWTITGFTSQLACIQSAASGNTAKFTTNLAGTIVNVLWFDWTGATFTIVTKNAAGTTLNTTSVTPANTQVWKRTTITGISGLNVGGSVTITTTSSNVIIAAVEVKNAGGYSVHNAGLAGSQATGTGIENWADTSSNYNALNIWGVYQTTAYDQIPCVVHCEPLYYDVSTPATPAAVTAAYITIRNRFPNSDFVIHAQPRPGSSTDATWFPYLSALYDAADSLDCPLLDVEQLLGGYATEAALGMTGDATAHLKISAYGIWGAATAALAAT